MSLFKIASSFDSLFKPLMPSCRTSCRALFKLNEVSNEVLVNCFSRLRCIPRELTTDSDDTEDDCCRHNTRYISKTNTVGQWSLRQSLTHLVTLAAISTFDISCTFKTVHKSITGILSSDNCINIRTDCMCGFYYVLSGVAFYQLLLNEYCIVLYVQKPSP